MITQVLIDLDDVLCDCTGAAMHHMGVHDWRREDHTLHYRNIYEMYAIKTGIEFTPAQFWEHFKREFWASIPPTPWCHDLIDLALEYVDRESIAILTTPTKDGDCLAGKLDWIEDHLPPWMHRQYIMSPRKHFCAMESAVLIDDAEENVEKFTNLGGLAITLPQPWNYCRPHIGEELTYTKGWLDYYKNCVRF